MRNQNDVCHIAIPCNDLDETVEFYVNVLGCKLARRKDDRVTFNFFGDQLVCHLSPNRTNKKPEFYPYHFGITFSEVKEFDALLDSLKSKKVNILQSVNRFPGLPDEHKTFFVADPSNNIIEFKFYFNEKMKY